MYICMYICMYKLCFVWSFRSLYYLDKVSSGISQWKTAVFYHPQLSVKFKVSFACSPVSVSPIV